MKCRNLIALVMMGAVCTAQSPQAKKPELTKPDAKQPEKSALSLKDVNERRSYALGMDLGNQLRALGLTVDPEIFAIGLHDSLSGGKTIMTQDEVREAIAELQAEMKRKQLEVRKDGLRDGKEAGTAFLAANSHKAGVVTLPSGLQYQVLTSGTGPKPTIDDVVACNYRGMLVDGTEFDSSYKRGEPTVFPLRRVIPGWTEALQLMPVGSKWRLFIPPDLAYGDRGTGDTIGPNATLIFEVELISILGKK